MNTYANGIRELGNFGTHKTRLTITAADVHISLSQVISVVEWYVQGAPGNPEPAKKQPPKPPPPEPPKKPSAIVPKGLRSFDAGDAKFFLELLPGPRDDKGLPESLRFWKHRIETTQELTFTVGVIYGPSGCGKSSLVKAGLLPRLGERILSVYVEATADDTEARLLQGLRKRCPDLPGRPESDGHPSALRQGKSLSKAQKVLIVLDQFEQWLHAKRGEEDTELAQALRQCDGERLQCVVLVRDDFWMGLTRFMQRPAHRACPGPKRRPRGPVRPAARQEGADGLRPGIRDAARNRVQRAGVVPRSSRSRAGPGWPGHLRAAGPPCRDGQGQALDPGHLERGRRHGRRRRGLPGGNLQSPADFARTSKLSERS